MKNFDDLDWHDSIIKNIVIDRSDPGRKDIIQLEIKWNSGTNNTLEFEGVYFISFEMNFGIVSEENILQAFSKGRSDKMVQNLYKKWKGMIDDINLNLYQIETNSTGGTIKIIAKRYYIRESKM